LFITVRSPFSSFSRVVLFTPSSAFSTTTSTFEDSTAPSVTSSSYTSRSLRTFRALRTLRTRYPLTTTGLRLLFLFGGDRTNARRIFRQSLRPLLTKLLPDCTITFAFRPSGVALRHPNFSAIALDASRRLQRGALIERELTIEASSDSAREFAVSSLPRIFSEVISGLKQIGRRPLSPTVEAASSLVFSSNASFQLRLFSISFPNSASSITRRPDEAISLLNVPSPLSITGPSAVSLEPVKVRNSIVGGLFHQREASALRSIDICLAPPIPFVSLLSLLERRCRHLQNMK
jgi:hypothetical protein